MKISKRVFLPLACSAGLFGGVACAGDQSEQPAPAEKQEVLTIPDPTAADFVEMKGTSFSNKSLRGDITKEAGTFLSRTAPGGVAPWHWHTPIEEFVVLTGDVVVQILGSEPISLKPGGYSQVPAGHTHRFRCVSEAPCILFTVGAGAYDLHWVDEDRNELTSEEAFARPNEVGVTW